MHLVSSYPVIMTDVVAKTASFYKEQFGYTLTYETDWYVSLQKAEGDRFWELAVLRFDHETVPPPFRNKSQGVLINMEVSDAAEVYRRLVTEGPLDAIKPLTDESFGQRHFILLDPAGNMVDVIENVPPSEEEAENFIDE